MTPELESVGGHPLLVLSTTPEGIVFIAGNGLQQCTAPLVQTK